MNLTQDQLENSVFYPSCGDDLTPIELLSSISNTFIYCDWNVRFYNQFRNTIESRKNFDVLDAHDSIIDINHQPDNYPPKFYLTEKEQNRRQQKLAENDLVSNYSQCSQYVLISGDKEVNLIHIRAEALATYCHLFQSGRIAPKFLINVNSGAGLGGGFVCFEDPKGITRRFLKCCVANPLIWIRGGMKGAKDTIEEPASDFYDREIKALDNWGEAYLVSAFCEKENQLKAEQLFLKIP